MDQRAPIVFKGLFVPTGQSDELSVGYPNSERQLNRSLHVFRYVGKTDSITISVWNHKKIHKKQGAGFLGCVRLLSNAISRLKDTGCKNQMLFCLSIQPKKAYEASFFF